MALSFRYKSVKRPDGTSVKAPMIPLTIFGKENIDTMGLLDSGADISILTMFKKYWSLHVIYGTTISNKFF